MADSDAPRANPSGANPYGADSPRAIARLAGEARLAVERAAGEIRQATPQSLSSAQMAAEAQGELFRLAQRFRDQIVVTALAEQRAEH